MRCLYVTPVNELGLVDEPALDSTTERHKIDLAVRPYRQGAEVFAALEADRALRGLIIECDLGWVGGSRLMLSSRALSRGYRVWLYWPRETALECLDRERISSLWRHWYFIKFMNGWSAGNAVWQKFQTRARALMRDVPPWKLPVWAGRRVLRSLGLARTSAPVAVAGVSAPAPAQAPRPTIAELDELIKTARPVPLQNVADPTHANRISGCGVYLRTDFWSPLKSGGSYGHTCYVAKELAAVTDRFVCFLANHYALLDEYGVRQVVLEHPSATAAEDDIVSATPHYVRLLKPAFEALKPAYIYERICIGNYAGALLSKALGIPYIVEYNGSEISMRRSFDGIGYLYEEEYIRAEILAFAQATMISVVSAEVKNGLVRRGINPAKILVNPNGADLEAYSPG